jgi:hypothetical protein
MVLMENKNIFKSTLKMKYPLTSLFIYLFYQCCVYKIRKHNKKDIGGCCKAHQKLLLRQQGIPKMI